MRGDQYSVADDNKHDLIFDSTTSSYSLYKNILIPLPYLHIVHIIWYYTLELSTIRYLF